MKRKLDQDGVPSPITNIESPSLSAPSFDSLGLDTRILQATAKQNFSKPTEVQIKAIPLSLAGKDVFACSKTGSGKTAAYVLPIIQSILHRKTTSKTAKCTSALILVPTKELAQQVTKMVKEFTAFCAQDVQVVNLTENVPESVQRTQLADLPDVVVTTPSRAMQNLDKGALSLEYLAHLVIDEADLVLSYGHKEDLQGIEKAMPKGIQTFLMSATLTTEVKTLEGQFCRDPVVIELKETEKDDGGVSQYVVKCAEDEKFLLVYVVFKLKLIKGKCIIFVGDTDRGYRLKLFFEQFGIKSCVLNEKLPVNSRIHVVEEFNKGVYDIIIASDEHEALGDKEGSARKGETVNKDDTFTNGDDTTNQADGVPPSKRKRQNFKKRDKEYGISRGIDFRNVACVLNFDLPTSAESYVHRIGRTARAGKTGMALSFVILKDQYRKHIPTTFPTTEHDEASLAAITSDQENRGKQIQPYEFDMKQVNAFRYRMNDALRAVTSVAVREARTREIRQELLKSDKLKRHFEENPEDLRNLRHDGELRAARTQAHLKHVPDYLLPSGGAKDIVRDVGFVGLRKEEGNRLRKIRAMKKGRGKGGGGKGGNRKGSGGDVLKTLRTGRK